MLFRSCAFAFYSAADADGWTFALPEIVRAIKTASARGVHNVANRVGGLWQDESFGHVLRGTKAYEKRLITFDKTQSDADCWTNQNRMNGFGPECGGLWTVMRLARG